MRYTILLLTLLCAACSSALPSFKPYRMDIQQGNIVTSKMLMQLKPGMSKSQARFVMGTPLLQDSFHGDRWDYFYQYRKDGKIIQQRRVILEFENEQLKRVRGDTIPAGVDPTVPELQRRSVEPEKGLWDRLKFWKSDEAPTAAAGAAAVATTQALAETPSSKDVLDPMLVNPPASSPARPSDVSDPAEPVAPAVVQDAPAAAPAPSKPAAAAPAASSAAPAKQAAPAASGNATSAPAAKSAPAKAAPAAASKPAPEEDLPPEEDPGYFERMLEKIGF